MVGGDEETGAEDESEHILLLLRWRLGGGFVCFASEVPLNRNTNIITVALTRKVSNHSKGLLL